MRQKSNTSTLLRERSTAVYHILGEASINVQLFGSTWEPSPLQIAKLEYRGAAASRMGGDPGDVQRAVSAIEHAAEMLPADPEIARERDAIIKWALEAMSINFH
jgi:hypothetical protein